MSLIGDVAAAWARRWTTESDPGSHAEPARRPRDASSTNSDASVTNLLKYNAEQFARSAPTRGGVAGSTPKPAMPYGAQPIDGRKYGTVLPNPTADRIVSPADRSTSFRSDNLSESKGQRDDGRPGSSLNIRPAAFYGDGRDGGR